ncbi:MAG: hypothetical protein LBE56_12600 [Tannerella sp.]|jgi:hypothetical protein|nr:hypothetical protein [Tannerella sp.]
MENLGKANIINALNLYDYLALYGFDKYHTKDDLIVLAMINDFLSNNCHYNILDDCLYRKLLCIVEKIMNGNPMMKYCRIFFTEYKNLDGSQNIRDYQKVKDETGIDYSIPAFKYTIDQSPPAQIPSQGGGVVLDGSPTGFYQVGKKIVIPTVVPIATGYTFDY